MENFTNHQQKVGSEKLSGMEIDREVIFTDYENNYKKSVEKRQLKLLEKIIFIKKFLAEGEKIQLVTTAISPITVLEQFLTGLILFHIKRCLLVFTNKRIFHIPTKTDYSYRYSVADVFYEDCKLIKIKGSTLVIHYKNGSIEKFYYLNRRERKKLKQIFENMEFHSSPEVEKERRGRKHLCPRCTKELMENKYECMSCNLEFKSLKEGKKISWLYPGGGYFYTKHYILGVFDAIVEAYLILFAVACLIIALTEEIELMVAFIFILFALMIEKLISVYHAKSFIKEYIPKQKEII